MHYVFDNHIYSFSSMNTYVILIWKTYFLFFITITFEVDHTFVSKPNASAHGVLDDSTNILHLKAIYVPSHL